MDEVSEGDHVDVATLSDDVLDDVAADAYGLLNGVLESLDDHYVHRQPGLQRTIEEVDGLLRRVDADLHKHLDEVGVLLLQAVRKSTSASGAPDNSSLRHAKAMKGRADRIEW